MNLIFAAIALSLTGEPGSDPSIELRPPPPALELRTPEPSPSDPDHEAIGGLPEWLLPRRLAAGPRLEPSFLTRLSPPELLPSPYPRLRPSLLTL